MPTKSSKRVLAANLAALMKSRGWSARELSRRTKGEVSDRYIGMILKGEYSASVEVLDQLAAAFGLYGWEIVVPGLPSDPEAAQFLSNLVKAYLVADKEGQAYVLHVADREARYLPKPSRK